MTGESRDSNDRSKNNTSSNSTNPSNSDNPFIRWRHYADEQVSSILQGFIGLPTIFDKGSNNSHWAVFDEDLRKRDAMQEQQRRLKEAHQAEGVKATIPDEVEIPVKKSSQRSDNPPYLRGLVGQGSSEVPLYAEPQEGRVAQIYRTYFGQDFGLDTNNLSLLPYLASSRYSPLRLSLQAKVRRDQQSLFAPTFGSSPALDNFPYCEAFEDLLLTTQGKSLHNSGSYFKGNKSEDIRSCPQNTIKWIARLQKLGLLSIPSSKENLSPLHNYEEVPIHQSRRGVPPLEKSKKDAETEEEMYERFLAKASSTPVQFFTNLESAFSAVEKLMKIASKNFDEPLRVDPSQTQIKSKDVSLSTPADAEKEVLSRTTVTHYTFDDGSVETTTKVLKRFADEREMETSKTISGPPRVVATTKSKFKPVGTHSEQEVRSHSVVEHENQSDGTVSTDIYVWKVFADGSETETSSGHSRRARSLESVEKGEQNDAGSVQPDEQDGKKAKSGWFWS